MFRTGSLSVPLAAMWLGALPSHGAVPTPQISDPAYTHAQRLVQVEPGRRINLYCIGSGSPTVVFDSGLGDDTSVWGLVQPVVAQRSRACTYDRAGLGFSDPARRASTSSAIVEDLHALLASADIKPPYVLVGHSYGGMNAVLYADRYPTEVVGMVLVDPAHEDQVIWQRRFYPHYDAEMLEPGLARGRACVAQAKVGFVAGTDIYKACIDPPDPRFSDAINATHLALRQRPAFMAANLSEMESIRGGVSGAEVHAARRSFGGMPLIVLTRSPNKTPPKGETEASDKAGFKAWMDMHDELASRSSRGRNRIVADTDHYIQFDQPHAVNEAINQVLDAVKAGNPRPTVR